MGESVSGVSFSRETLSITLIEELKPILEEHYKEIAHYQDIPLRPSFDSYWQIHRDGNLRIFIARLNGEPIGYNVVFLRNNMHYTTSKQAVQDILYVMGEYRGDGIGRLLIKYSDEQLALEGAQVMAHHVKVVHPALGHILETEGYELVEYVYTKRLDRPASFPSYSEHMANIQAWEAAQGDK